MNVKTRIVKKLLCFLCIVVLLNVLLRDILGRFDKFNARKNVIGTSSKGRSV